MITLSSPLIPILHRIKSLAIPLGVDFKKFTLTYNYIKANSQVSNDVAAAHCLKEYDADAELFSQALKHYIDYPIH